MDLAALVYPLTASLPETENFGLTSQLRRAAVSVPSSLAEGHSRGSTKDSMRFISIAMGSLAEVETQLMLCSKLTMIEKQAVEPLLGRCDEQNRISRGLKMALAAKLPQTHSRPSSLASRP
jgi:four helix bundle protein